MMKTAISILLAAAAVGAPAQAKKPAEHVWPELGVEARIVFPNQDAIRNFEADGNEGIWLEDRQRRWYYADFVGGCQELNFRKLLALIRAVRLPSTNSALSSFVANVARSLAL